MNEKCWIDLLIPNSVVSFVQLNILSLQTKINNSNNK